MNNMIVSTVKKYAAKRNTKFKQLFVVITTKIIKRKPAIYCILKTKDMKRAVKKSYI
jgi:hypothetical protein